MGQRERHTFFDACAGVGCFHMGMRDSGFDCVGAAELDSGLQQRYPSAFGDDLPMFGDVRRVTTTKAWKSAEPGMMGSVMVAGFPCTPWSKSGDQSGKKHGAGTVFWSLLTMMDRLESPAFVFENVTNLLGDRHRKVWAEMRRELKRRGYHVGYERISTRDVGIPQNRNRVFIVGRKADGPGEPEEGYFAEQFRQIKSLDPGERPLGEVIYPGPWGRGLSQTHREALEVWDQYLGWTLEDDGTTLAQLPKPLWAMEAIYKHTYDITRLQGAINEAGGEPLGKQGLLEALDPSIAHDASHLDSDEIVRRFLPPYYRKVALGTAANYAQRAAFAMNSRTHMDHLEKWVSTHHSRGAWDAWYSRLKSMDPSFQKFEYHIARERPPDTRGLSGDEALTARFGGHLVQFRSSGVRVSRSNRFPTLVAIGQVPYTGSPEGGLKQPSWEALARLQSIPDGEIRSKRALFGSNGEPVRRLGNAVNVEIVRQIGERLRAELEA